MKTLNTLNRHKMYTK